MNTCFLCKKAEESCNHLLLWCPTVFELWTLVYRAFGIDWVIAGSVREELLAWKYQHSRYSFAELIPLTILRTAWKERNRRVFDGLDNTKDFDVLKDGWLRTQVFYDRSFSSGR